MLHLQHLRDTSSLTSPETGSSLDPEVGSSHDLRAGRRGLTLIFGREDTGASTLLPQHSTLSLPPSTLNTQHSTFRSKSPTHFHLTQRIDSMVLESPFPHKTVNVLYRKLIVNNKLAILGGVDFLKPFD